MFIGVDVGSRSIRVALFDTEGRKRKHAERDITVHHPAVELYEQSSDEIWTSCCELLSELTEDIDKSSLRGIGFTGTCSLVISSRERATELEGSGCDIIMWLDHRAMQEAEEINASGHPLLDFVGGKVSLEMQMPKLLWLKRNRPEVYQRADYFFDLPDYMTWRATQNSARQGKWNHPGEGKTWDKDFLNAIGLEELADGKKIGITILPPGTPIPQGISAAMASQTKLPVGLPVGASLIDAHAGALGLLSCIPKGLPNFEVDEKLLVIAGTSACHMALRRDPSRVPGVWGPQGGSILQGYFTHEGGISAAGEFLSRLLASHPGGNELIQTHSESGAHAVLCKEIERMDASATRDIHVWPDVHGNRSPLADPRMKGM
ncbi:unnamed protein product, partial [Cyprideis torosa]